MTQQPKPKALSQQTIDGIYLKVLNNDLTKDDLTYYNGLNYEGDNKVVTHVIGGSPDHPEDVARHARYLILLQLVDEFGIRAEFDILVKEMYRRGRMKK